MPAAWLEWVMTALLGMILLYTVLGGMLSVLVTDYLQFIVKGAGLVITSIIIISDFGWNNLVTGLWLCFDGTVAERANSKRIHLIHSIPPILDGVISCGN
jgi:Na+(H+)/acetate symporter ActP